MIDACRNLQTVQIQMHRVMRVRRVERALIFPGFLAMVMSLTLVSAGVHADDGWQDIGLSVEGQSGTTPENDEWAERAPKKPANDAWVDIGTQPGDQLSSLVPTLSALDIPNNAPLDSEIETAAVEPIVVEPNIIEFGEDGSSADLELPFPDIRIDGQNVEQTIDHTNLDMFAGELKVLGQVDVTRVAIGNGGIIRAEILNTGELLIIAQQTGSTSLRLWNTDETQSSYNIRVTENDTETRVRMERMVRMRVRMVEFRKSVISQLGIDWDSSAAGPTFAAAGDAIGNNLFRPATDAIAGLPNRVKPFSTFFGIATEITSSINFLANNGDALTLAEPVLSAVNGGSASFLAGGEIPFPTTSDTGQPGVEFKEYGIKLDVAPVIDNAGNIRTLIKTEISSLDSATALDGVPGLLTRRAETEFNVQAGETIVISGLLNAESSDDVRAIPGIGRLPIIGRFFSTENKRNSLTELVIFVTPEVIEPGERFTTAREDERYDETSERLRQARNQLPIME